MMGGRKWQVLAVTNMYPTERDPTYGAFVASQIAAIAALGHQVDVEFVDGRVGPAAYLRAIGRIRRRVREGRFDVVHAHYGLAGFVSSFQPVPLVVSFCGDDLFGTPDGRGGKTWKSRLARRLSLYAGTRAEVIICKSSGMRAWLSNSKDRARALIIPNGVDTARFRPGDRTQARRILGLGEEERLVFFPHNQQARAQKRFDLAEAAMDELHRRGIHARLWTVNGVPPERMPLHFQAADCLLLTSQQEGSPNVVKEALCCDLPVVSVDVGDVAEWIGLSEGCRLVERDPREIANGLATVLRGVPRVDGGPVRRELDGPRVAARVVDCYRAAVESRSEPRAL